jgi:hypothetical protein
MRSRRVKKEKEVLHTIMGRELLVEADGTVVQELKRVELHDEAAVKAYLQRQLDIDSNKALPLQRKAAPDYVDMSWEAFKTEFSSSAFTKVKASRQQLRGV